MASPKNRLGRGLGNLISGGAKPAGSGATADVGKAAVTGDEAVKATPALKTVLPPVAGYTQIDVGLIDPSPYQQRRDIDEESIRELAQSILSEGLLQPVVVRSVAGGRYELIAGERRWRAFKHLGQKSIPARILNASDASAAALGLIENLQREGLNPIDEALGYASLIRDFDLTQEAVSSRVGKARATIANALRLLTLGNEIQGYVSRRLISVGHAKVLLGIESEDQRKLFARRIIETGMSVREAEAQVSRLKEGGRATRSGSGDGSEGSAGGGGAEETAVRDLERRLGEYLNTRILVKHGGKRGKLVIDYFGNDDLDRILDRIGLPTV